MGFILIRGGSQGGYFCCELDGNWFGEAGDC